MMTMSLAFLMLATGQVPELRAETMLAQAFEMPKNLFYLVQSPSGTMFCDKSLKRRQARRFDKRYGSRVNRLASVIAAREGLGWGNDVVVVPCYIVSQQEADSMLSALDAKLRDLEVQFGL